MRIILSSKAEKQLRKLPRVDQIAAVRKIRLLKEEKGGSGGEKLTGYKNIFRVRIGNLRIVYRRTSREIYIILIGHRKDVYQLLRQLF